MNGNTSNDKIQGVLRHASHPNDVLILDGGMSRELMRANAPFKQPEWSALALIEAPHTVQEVHHGFAKAGADILTTNSYALVPFHIGEDRFWSDAEKLANLSGQLARNAANEVSKRESRQILVAGSLPPIFGSYLPDHFDPARVQEYLAVLVKGLSPYVDVWLGETLSLVAEAEAVATAVKPTDKPFWISFTLKDGAEGTNPPMLRSGEPVIDAVSKVVELGASGLLFNCSRPEVMDAAITQAAATLTKLGSEIRLGVYANAFEPAKLAEPANEHIAVTRDDLGGEVYNSFARDWVKLGARIVGGCCGIGHDHIEKLAQLLKSSQKFRV